MHTTLPFDWFARVQSRLFPVYFIISTICGLLTTLSVAFATNMDNLQLNLLMIGTILSFSQLIFISPKTEHYMEIYMKIRKNEGQDSKTDEFKKAKGVFFKWHGISSLINIGVAMIVTFHIYYLSSKFTINIQIPTGSPA